MNPSICLSMIVKNEGHCIEKCLNSIKNHISYWIICDTGSSDNTEEIVKSILKDIPGEFHKHKWVDFAHNRNLSLNLSKNKADYTLIIDADDWLECDNLFNLSGLCYQIEFIHSNISYHRIQLIKNNINAKYIGVLHEYLDVGEITPIILNNCKIHYGGIGARSKDPEKFLKDAQILENAIKSEPYNSRYIFYCAQSYKDAGRYDKALEFYKKRIEMGGWIEEIYFSILECGKLMEVNRCGIQEIESTYLKAYNLLPSRVESLVYLCIFCRKNKFYDKSYFYGNIGIKIPQPINGLFIEPECYTWKIMDELAIAAYYVGKFEESVKLNKLLLTNKNLPKWEVQRISDNLKFGLNYNSVNLPGPSTII